MSSSSRCSVSQAASTTLGKSERCNDLDLSRDRGAFDEPVKPRCNGRKPVEGDTEGIARAQHPRNVRDVGEPVVATAEPGTLPELGVEPGQSLVEAGRRPGRA